MRSNLFNLEDWIGVQLRVLEGCLECWVGKEVDQTHEFVFDSQLTQAMRYAVLDGGKRLRPLLVLAAWEAVNDQEDCQKTTSSLALRAACAVELIHAYSLVHDDLPCMDNDILRRGKPTVHVKFGEAMAMLAGDALQALAFEVLTPHESIISPLIQAQLCRILALSAGAGGMAGGQAIDLSSVGVTLNEIKLQEMHRLKTGSLLEASVMMGAACGQASEKVLSALSKYAQAIGLAFQVVDDILDVTSDSNTLGKTAGKDSEQHKPTYVSLMGLVAAKSFTLELLDKAKEALVSSGLSQGRTQALNGLAMMVVNRSN